MQLGSNKTDTGSWRLPKVSKAPGLADVLALAEQAASHKDRPAKMLWMFGNPAISYTLTASGMGIGTSDGLLWTLASGESRDEVEVWTHMSADCTLIHNMIMASLRNGQSPDASSTEAPPPALETQTRPSIPAPEPAPIPASPAAEILRGDLANTRIDQLLDAIAGAHGTGRVVITNQSGSSEILFAGGLPVHARHEDLKGDAALVEILGVRQGTVEFHAGKPSEEKTVTKSLEALMFLQTSLGNYSNYLKDHRLREDTPLIRLSPDLSEPEFDRLLSAAAPVDMQLQKQIYLAIDGKSTLADILTRHPLPRSEWIPILFNLIACQLVAVIEIPRIPYLPISAAAIELNRHLLRVMREKVIASQTGLYTFPALLLFLEQELNRYQDCKRPFSLALMKMNFQDISPEDLVMQEAAIHGLSEPIRRIIELKRRCDLFCHYKTSEYALLLPETETSTAREIMEGIFKQIGQHALSADGVTHPLVLECGVASIPEQCDTIEALLALAESYQKVF